MNDKVVIESYLRVNTERKKSRMPACMDKWQSITGLVLALFILCHMIFTSSILCGSETFDWIVVNLAEFGILGLKLPIITTFVVIIIFAAFVAHAFLAMRKFPANYAQLRIFATHRALMKHCDTTLWFLQFITGFILFFMGGAHLFTILMNSTHINALESAARFVSGNLAEFYLVLLVVMVIHASIGLYRLIIKWVPLGATSAESNSNRQKIKALVFIVFIVLGVIAFIADFAWIALGKSL